MQWVSLGNTSTFLTFYILSFYLKMKIINHPHIVSNRCISFSCWTQNIFWTMLIVKPFWLIFINIFCSHLKYKCKHLNQYFNFFIISKFHSFKEIIIYIYIIIFNSVCYLLFLSNHLWKLLVFSELKLFLHHFFSVLSLKNIWFSF